MTLGINAPQGLVPVGYLGASGWNGSFRLIPITAAYGTGLFRGDLVTYAAGLLVRYTAGNTTGTAGVFQGCIYQDTQGIEHFSEYWPAAQATAAGTTPMAQVIMDPSVIYTIQSSGTLVTANIDYNCEVTFATAGSTSTGISGMALGTTPAVTATLPVRIIDFDPTPGNVSGVPFNNALVVINQSAFKTGTTGV
jgi:hypothetical protein